MTGKEHSVRPSGPAADFPSNGQGSGMGGNHGNAGVVVMAVASVSDKLRNPDALLLRTDLQQLGHPRRAVDAIFQSVAVIALPGYSRPMIRVSDYNAHINKHTYPADGSRVRLTGGI